VAGRRERICRLEVTQDMGVFAEEAPRCAGPETGGGVVKGHRSMTSDELQEADGVDEDVGR
jgi:hypothetical protein